MKDLSSMSAAVKIVIDNYPIGHEFYGNELKDDVVKIYPDAVNMYPDTILKMARRHRRDSYISIDRNNSLYQRVESGIERAVRIAKETPRLEGKKKHEKINQPDLFSYAFLAVFFVLVFGLIFSAFGRPLVPCSFINSIASTRYKAAEPIYCKGSISNRLRRFLAASDEIPSFWEISRTVIPSMYPSIYEKKSVDQEVKCPKVLFLRHLLQVCIVKNQKNCKICEISDTTLDFPLGRVYNVLKSYCWDNKKRFPETLGAEKANSRRSIIYEKTEEKRS